MKNKETKAQLIGRKIKEARTTAKKSQAELANELGFESAVAISLIEKGERNINVENLDKIANYFHKDIRFFLGEEDTPVKIEVALRSQKDLAKEYQDAILRFIELAKRKHVGRK